MKENDRQGMTSLNKVKRKRKILKNFYKEKVVNHQQISSSSNFKKGNLE